MANEETRQRDLATSREHTADEAHERSVGREAFAPRAKLDLPNPAEDPAVAHDLAARTSSVQTTSAPEGSHAGAPAQEDAGRKRVARLSAADIPAVIPAGERADGTDAVGDAVEDAPADEAADQATQADQGDQNGVGTEQSEQSRQSDQSEGTDQSEQSEQSEEPSRNKTPFGKVFLGLLAAAVVLVVATASWFAWDRWGRYDDHADMQGDWYVEGTAVLVPIDGSSIKLADDVVYSYDINDHDKTISYTFGDWKGSGRYWFSEDRRTLVITDGDEFTGASNTVDDLVQLFNDRVTIGNGGEVELPEGDGIIVFRRSPNPRAFIIKTIKEQLAAQEAAKHADEENYDEYDEDYEYYEDYEE